MPALTTLLTAAALAAFPEVPVDIEISYTAPPGQAVFVLGDRPELGGGDLRNAVKLINTQGNIHTVPVSLPQRTGYTIRFYLRDDAPGRWGDPANGTPVTTELVGVTPGLPAPNNPTLFAYTTFDRPVLHHRTAGGAYESIPMRHIGPGRTPGERLVAATGVGDARTDTEFYIDNAAGFGRVPSAGTLALFTDRAIVQDNEVFAYLPDPATPTPLAPARKDYDPQSPPTIFSSILNETRTYRVFLPRGYDTHTDKTYPVLYMHDGQNVFDQGAFGTWNADETAARITRAGITREVIIVALDHGPDRTGDYLPPDDGRDADDYTRFITDEIMPLINATYRTATGPENTATAGSSFGGIVSLYQAYTFPDTFGKAGVFSPSLWATPNLRARIATTPNPDLRLYLDSGDAGASNDGFAATVALRDLLLTKQANPYTLEGNLRHAVGLGQAHNEPAWAARFPGALRFLFPADEEPDRGLDTLPATPPCPADIAPPFDGLTFSDIATFLDAYLTTDPLADLAPPFNDFTFADITTFLTTFTAGCP